jgi:uncharacterized glyoxalase superfamily protein PhnB
VGAAIGFTSSRTIRAPLDKVWAVVGDFGHEHAWIKGMQQVPWSVDGVLVEVDDVDAHFARAKAAGATILSDWEGGFPGRRYRAADPEGHRWMFQPAPPSTPPTQT